MRVFLFIIATLLSASNLPAQSLSELNSRILDLYRKGNHEAAIPLALRAKEMARTEYGDTSSMYVTTLESLALLYTRTNRYSLSIPLYKEAAGVISRTKGEINDRFVFLQTSLAMALSDLEEYKEAEPCFTRVKEISRQLYGENSNNYITSLTDLAVLYSSMGQYGKAEEFFLQALLLGKKAQGENSVEYSNTLNGLGILYYNMGQYDKAERYYLQAMAIRKVQRGENSPSFASVQNNLAALYAKKGDYVNAESLYRKAAETEKANGENTSVYANTLGNLAINCSRTGRYEEATTLLDQVKTIRLNTLGENHPRYAATLNDMGALFLRMGQYEKAAQFLQQALEKRKTLLGEEHLDFANTLNNLASLYASTGQFEKAEECLLQTTAIRTRYLENVFSVFSEKEKENYLANNLSLVETDNSLLYLQPKKSPALIRNNLELQLLLKSLALNQTRSIRETIAASSDSNLRQAFRQWEGVRKTLAGQYSLPLASRVLKTDSLEANAELLEKELVRKVAGYETTLKLPVEKLKEKLNGNEAAIEFVVFNFYNKKWTDSILYVAYIIRKDLQDPVFVPLCEEKQLGRFFSPAGGVTAVKTIYRSEVVDENESPSISGDSLYALVWKPLMPYLTGIKKINYSPAGLLYKVAFHALPAGDSTLLMDHFELNQYVSLRQSIFPARTHRQKQQAVLFGDCRFDNESQQATVTKGWKPLPGTAEETQFIKNIFEQQQQPVILYTQNAATEEAFKSLNGHAPAILHLATHGFFLSDPEKRKKEGFAADERNVFTIADNPLQRSGIILAGANQVWTGKPPVANREDGIVTAYETAQLDLSGTELVVLSACETALGDIKGNEGVFGLQRAFKMAGARNLILSLWKVPDTETAEMMKVFYRHYVDGLPVRDAFHQAQQYMRKKYKPYYWAAFILLE